MSKDTKIQISTGCTDFLVGEIETLRRRNEIIDAKVSVVDNFFGMINRLGDQQRTGYGQDQLWQAKQEIRAATIVAETAAAPPTPGAGEGK